MAMPAGPYRPPKTRTRVIWPWRMFLAFMYNLLAAPWLMLFCRFNRWRKAPTVFSVTSNIDNESEAFFESTDRSTLHLSQPEESSEPEDSAGFSVFVTSKTDIDSDDHDKSLANHPSINAPEIEVGVGDQLTPFKTTAKEFSNDLLYVHRQLHLAISVVRKLQEACKQDDIDGETDKTRDEETSYYLSVDLPREDDGDVDIDAKNDHAQQVSSTSPPETSDTDRNVAEEPPEDQGATEVAATAETGQTVDGSSCNDQPIAPLRSQPAEGWNEVSDSYTGTPDNGRPPENNCDEPQGGGYVDGGPHEMLHLDPEHPGIPNTTIGFTKQRNCFNADTCDPSAGPPGLFEIDENPGPLSATDGFLQDGPWDDCGGMNDEVDSGPKEMLFALPNTLADIGRLKHGDDDDDDNGYHGDVSSGDDQLPRDAWDLERHEDAADKGLVVSAMRHVSKPSGQDMGIVGEDTDDLKLSIEATGNEKDNSRASVGMEPQGSLRVNNNYNNNSDSNDIGCTPDADCG
ncbi:Hypp5578 [Branchiostoma lanceolatum]|uniref:Hypp5578 protein n=1 Tax=Branchiostoma lanceolatum TaxID=7740 RepID=A0A8J9YR77_BRALA|nr:Hypp5578 [Branchiostoma lanceolatum]